MSKFLYICVLYKEYKNDNNGLGLREKIYTRSALVYGYNFYICVYLFIMYKQNLYVQLYKRRRLCLVIQEVVLQEIIYI